MNMYLAPGLQCISNNIAEEQNLPHSHIRLQNKMSMEPNVNIIAGTSHGAIQAMHDSRNLLSLHTYLVLGDGQGQPIPWNFGFCYPSKSESTAILRRVWKFAHTPKTSENMGKWGQSGHRYFIWGTDKIAFKLQQGNLGCCDNNNFPTASPSTDIIMSWVRQEVCCGAKQRRRWSGAEAPAVHCPPKWYYSSRIIVTSDCSVGKLSSWSSASPLEICIFSHPFVSLTTRTHYVLNIKPNNNN